MMSNNRMQNEDLIDTPFGARSLTETLGLVVQLEVVGCSGTATILRNHLKDTPDLRRRHSN